MGEHLSPGEAPAGAGRPSPSLLELWWSWLAIGAFSLGGGAATLLQMRRVWVDRHGWVSGPFFDRAFQMSQVVPGINILAVAIQLGRVSAGWPGILVALVGLLLPSATITVLLTQVFGFLQAQAFTRAALDGVVPATGGLTAAVSVQMVAAAFRGSGRGRRGLRDLAVVLVCVVGLGVFRWPAPLILLAAAAFGALLPEAPPEAKPAGPGNPP
jgi:chromate transporter